jgi:riboflavin synthase
MFTGIVEEAGRVTSASSKRLTIAARKALEGMEPGGSIAVNGVCLTVTSYDSSSFSVDIMPETLNRTNLGLLHIGDEVNLERALSVDRLLGGHFMQGHVDVTGRITSVMKNDEGNIFKIEAPSEVMNYIVEKGYIAVDGISLTIVARDADSFKVSVVDYTLKNTIIGSRRVGDLVNLEVDIIAKYVEQLKKKEKPAIDYDFLEEHGFLAG